MREEVLNKRWHLMLLLCNDVTVMFRWCRRRRGVNNNKRRSGSGSRKVINGVRIRRRCVINANNDVSVAARLRRTRCFSIPDAVLPRALNDARAHDLPLSFERIRQRNIVLPAWRLHLADVITLCTQEVFSESVQYVNTMNFLSLTNCDFERDQFIVIWLR